MKQKIIGQLCLGLFSFVQFDQPFSYSTNICTTTLCDIAIPPAYLPLKATSNREVQIATQSINLTRNSKCDDNRGTGLLMSLNQSQCLRRRGTIKAVFLCEKITVGLEVFRKEIRFIPLESYCYKISKRDDDSMKVFV